jgi:protease PrsW
LAKVRRTSAARHGWDANSEVKAQESKPIDERHIGTGARRSLSNFNSAGGGLAVIARAAMLNDPDYDHLFAASPLRRRRPCILITALLVSVLAFAALVQLSLFVAMRPDVVRVFFRALILSTVLASVPLAVLWFLDRRERERPWLFAAAFLWGGCIATALALPFNTAFFTAVDYWVAQNPTVTDVLGPDAALLLAAPISAPIVEETAKALGVLVLFWLLQAEFDNMRDGIVYGALIGLGFNWFEAALYVAQGYAEYGVPPYGLQLGFRYSLFGLGGHTMFTAIFGASVGLAVQTRHTWLRILAPIAGLSLAIAAHMLNNALPLIMAITGAGAGEQPQAQEPLPDIGFLEAFIAGSVTQLVIFLPFIVMVAILVWRSGVWERLLIRDELASEVGRSLTADEYQDVISDNVLRTRRIDGLRPRASAALVNAQHELAFRKRRVKDRQRDPEGDPLVARWRQNIQLLRTNARPG